MVPSVQAPNKSAHSTVFYSHQEMLDAPITHCEDNREVDRPAPHETKDSWGLLSLRMLTSSHLPGCLGQC